jgi:MinD superfamily P-loop ATPase
VFLHHIKEREVVPASNAELKREKLENCSCCRAVCSTSAHRVYTAAQVKSADALRFEFFYERC